MFSPQAEKNVDIKILHLQITFDCFFPIAISRNVVGKSIMFAARGAIVERLEWLLAEQLDLRSVPALP